MIKKFLLTIYPLYIGDVMKNKTGILMITMILFFDGIISGTSVYKIPTNSKEYLGAKVEYTRSFIHPVLEIELPAKGYGVITASILLPNGSPMELGTFSGRDKVKISYGELMKAMKLRGFYLKNAGLDSKAVSPSLLLLGTLHDDDGNVGYFVETVPINVEEVLERRSIRVNLPKENPRILYTKKQIMEKLSSMKLQRTNDLVSNKNNREVTPVITEGWPPGSHIDNCYRRGYNYQYCLVWRLERIVTVKSNALIPVATFEIRGDTDKINGITITSIYHHKTAQGLELTFSAAAAMQKGGDSSSIEAQIIGTSYSIDTRDIGISSSYVRVWGSEILDPSVIGAGIRGTVALAKYRLCVWDGLFYEKLDDVAYVILGKPDERDMELRKFVEHGEPNRYGGIGRKTMWFVHNYWKPTTHDGQRGGLTKYDVDFISSTDTIPLFTASAAVLGTLDYNNLEIFPFIMAVGLGFNTKSTEFSLIHVDLQLKEEYRDQYVNGVFYSSKVKFDYNGHDYNLAGMYGDIYIPGDGSFPPCNPRTGICPTSNDSTEQQTPFPLCMSMNLCQPF